MTHAASGWLMPTPPVEDPAPDRAPANTDNETWVGWSGG